MFMTDKHILIAVNNCGSSYGWNLLRDTCGGRLMTKTRHAPVYAIKPEWRKGRRVIALQRNPFAWYVTGWYKNDKGRKSRGVERMTFEQWFWYTNNIPWRHLPSEYRPPPAAHILPGAYTFFHMHYCLRNSREMFATYRSMDQVDRDYDANLGIDDWVFAHSYYEDFARILGRPLVINKSQGRNSHPHRPHQDYYTPKLRAYVEKNDALLLRRYGYTFDGPAYSSAEHVYPECPSAMAVEMTQAQRDEKRDGSFKC